jgi:hypothetical protein
MDTVAELVLHRFDQLWRKGQIGDNTYLRSLVIAGVAPHEAATRLTLLRMGHDKD